MTLKVMPFGKYKDKPMSQVPASYLDWLEARVRRYIEQDVHRHPSGLGSTFGPPLILKGH